MTTITNHHNLPAALVAAVTNDPYRGGGDISVTKLIDAPQRRVLGMRHVEAVSVDVSERIWALLGQAVHNILERAGTDTLVEQRLFAEVEGWQLSGQFDRLHLGEKTLSDYKVTSTYKAGGDEQWTRQLNILRWLAHKNGMEVEKLEIVAIFRDHRGSEARRNPDYPQQAAAVIPVPLWTLEDTEAFIRERVTAHQMAQNGVETPCTDEDRWYSGTTYALMKNGGKRALKVAEDVTDLGIPTDDQHIVTRPGIYRRCESHCDVSTFCSQWQQHLAQSGGQNASHTDPE